LDAPIARGAIFTNSIPNYWCIFPIFSFVKSSPRDLQYINMLFLLCLSKLARPMLIPWHPRNDPEHEQGRTFKMTISTRNQFASIFAAIACAFLTIGISVAPAVAPVAPYLA
jgi:hypothetical protein